MLKAHVELLHHQKTIKILDCDGKSMTYNYSILGIASHIHCPNKAKCAMKFAKNHKA